MSADSAASGRVLFDALLHPHRSLSRRGFFLLLGVVVAVNATIGGFFLLHGAWPVFGYCGLDVLIVWLAFRQSYRSARVYEKVRLTERELSVERGDAWGRRQVHTFQPYWLRVRMDDPPRHESQVELTSHGRSVIVGSFLSPEERGDFARALGAALDGLRRSPAPAETPA